MMQWISGSWMSPRFIYTRISFRLVNQLPLRLTTPCRIASPRFSKLKWFSITPKSKSKTSNFNWMNGWSCRMHLRKMSLRVTWEVLIWPWLEWSLLTLDNHRLEKGLPLCIKMVQSLNPLRRSVHPQWSLLKF
jgi:hypothetical protein